MNPHLFYTLKMSHLQSLERELRALRNQLNELQALEREAPAPEYEPLDSLDTDYINLIAAVQRLRTEVQPLATQ